MRLLRFSIRAAMAATLVFPVSAQGMMGGYGGGYGMMGG